MGYPTGWSAQRVPVRRLGNIRDLPPKIADRSFLAPWVWIGYLPLTKVMYGVRFPVGGPPRAVGRRCLVRTTEATSHCGDPAILDLVSGE